LSGHTQSKSAGSSLILYWLQSHTYLHSTFRPWHVFVDTSPGTDADFAVAAIFDVEPTLDELNTAIVECLEGSKHEDEFVAQQMQQALDEGQLDKVSDMIGGVLEKYSDNNDDNDDDEEDFDDDEDFDMFDEDSV
jgi:hypothetical protein